MDSSLYEKDFALWVEQQSKYIEKRALEAIDWENIQEEIVGLGRGERHQLENRLEVLLEHLLKRFYVNSAYDNRGWELTLKEQRKQMKRLLRSSPSLKIYLAKILPEIWEDALSDVKDIYPTVPFPNEYPFSVDIDELLSNQFWDV
jgi:Domain of unknown function DUF29